MRGAALPATDAGTQAFTTCFFVSSLKSNKMVKRKTPVQEVMAWAVVEFCDFDGWAVL